MKKLSVAAMLLVNSCATFAPTPYGGPCRDPSTGRFISCSSGGGTTLSPTDTAILLSVAGVLLVGSSIAGYYVSNPPRNNNNQAPVTENSSPATNAENPLYCYEQYRDNRLVCHASLDNCVISLNNNGTMVHRGAFCSSHQTVVCYLQDGKEMCYPTFSDCYRYSLLLQSCRERNVSNIGRSASWPLL